MYQHNRIVVLPLRPRHVLEFPMHELQLLHPVQFLGHFMDEVSHQDKHHDVSIFLEYAGSRLAPHVRENALRDDSRVFNETENVEDVLDLTSRHSLYFLNNTQFLRSYFFKY